MGLKLECDNCGRLQDVSPEWVQMVLNYWQAQSLGGKLDHLVYCDECLAKEQNKPEEKDGTPCR